MKVCSWMTANPQTIGPDDTLDLAQRTMSTGHFRRLPVVDAEQKLIGIVTDRDLRAHLGYLGSTKVNAAMAEPVMTVEADAPLEEAADLLLKHKIGGLPVVGNGGQLVGIITETDLLKGMLDGFRGGDRSGSRIDFAFTNPEQTFAEAARVVETEGAVILGLGTLSAPQAGASARTFYLRVLSPDLPQLAEALRAKGYEVLATHAS